MKYPLSRIPLRALLTTLAAFLSLLVTAAPARASICWSGVQNVVLSMPAYSLTTHFDLNGDGTDDFAITADESYLIFASLGSNAAVATPRAYNCPLLPLPSGTSISSLLSYRYQWSTHPHILAASLNPTYLTLIDYPFWLISFQPGHSHTDSPCVEPTITSAWYPVSRRLGISFQVGEHFHFGWICMSCDGHGRFIIHDWAYETQAGAPIKTPANPFPILTPQVVRPGYLRLKWRRSLGKTYWLQTTTSLDSPTWTNVSSYDHWITPNHKAVDVRIEGPAQFFRLFDPTPIVEEPEPCSDEASTPHRLPD